MAPWGPGAVLVGNHWGGGSVPPSMDLPCRGVAPGEVGGAVGLASCTGPVVVRGSPTGGVGLAGAGILLRGRGGRANTASRTVGAVPVGSLGSGVQRAVGGAAIPGDSAARARGVVGRWGWVAGSGGGSGAGGVGWWWWW